VRSKQRRGRPLHLRANTSAQGRSRRISSDGRSEEVQATCRAECVSDCTVYAYRREVALPAIFELYHDDFGGSDADILYWVRAYVPAEIRADLDRALQKDDWVLRYHPLDITNTNAAKPMAPTTAGARGWVSRVREGDSQGRAEQTAWVQRRAPPSKKCLI
jgi:hypothetical protein